MINYYIIKCVIEKVLLNMKSRKKFFQFCNWMRWYFLLINEYGQKVVFGLSYFLFGKFMKLVEKQFLIDNWQ